MRVATMRPSATDAGCGDRGVGATTSEVIKNVVFREYLDSPRRSHAILEALRPCADGPAVEDGADGAGATMATIVATTGTPHQVHGTPSCPWPS
jgi:hypothetical protein